MIFKSICLSFFITLHYGLLSQSDSAISIGEISQNVIDVSINSPRSCYRAFYNYKYKYESYSVLVKLKMASSKVLNVFLQNNFESTSKLFQSEQIRIFPDVVNNEKKILDRIKLHRSSHDSFQSYHLIVHYELLNSVSFKKILTSLAFEYLTKVDSFSKREKAQYTYSIEQLQHKCPFDVSITLVDVTY